MQLEFCHKGGIYKYDKSMINVTNVWGNHGVINDLQNYTA